MAWRDDASSEVFDEDYLYFYADRLAAGPGERETEQILELLALEPGAAVLDAPCGHGRIANRLAAQGLEVVGLDSNPGFLELARSAAVEAGVEVEYVLGHWRELPWVGRFDTFMVSGHMCCGVQGDELILRLGPDGAERALESSDVRPMDFAGRPMRGFVTVQPDGLAGEQLRRWVEQAVAYATAPAEVR